LPETETHRDPRFVNAAETVAATPARRRLSAPIVPRPRPHAGWSRQGIVLFWSDPTRLTTVFVVLGVALRAFHYLRNPSVWHDEAALIINVLEKDFLHLLGALRFSEASPPAFLWLEKLISILCGDSTHALRAAPFIAGCLVVVLAPIVAVRHVERCAVPWFVLWLSCSDRLLWHACEAKQYSIEVLCALLLLGLVGREAGAGLTRRILILTIAAPFIIWLAYPGCFLYGGVLIGLMPQVWRRRDPRCWLCYIALALTVFVVFAGLLSGPIRAQHDATIADCWIGMRQFPDWSRPWSVAPWMVGSTTRIFGYCFEPAGEALALVAIVGLAATWRLAPTTLLAQIVPIALALVAACLGAYPYGGTRVMAFAAPALALLAAAGTPPALRWIGARSRAACVAATLVLLAPVGWASYRALAPWERADCAGASAFVLERRGPDERVVGNHWEYEYYFRHIGSKYLDISAMESAASGRVWLVVTGGTAALRDPLINQFARQGWLPIARREFTRTSVVLMEQDGTLE
jgi:hypothetical protein